METRDIVFSVVMVVSAFVLTYEWLGRFKYSPANSLIVLSAIVMVGALAAMILSVDMRLRRIEESIDSRDRSMRISLQSVEENIDHRMNEVTGVVEDALESFNRRNYR
ncbi:hypothetical protein J2755_001596 [Methanohalophilus levihalophilus]|uniref:hypothetical protein n=1 Tax=Methanohalophilus levihalophilus TaxID=1431282 RepID=UPI001AE56093|nr:hypothetical protein [Methanohalophilus levihalophilus]MBP2030648.1 hypothetical protein [Methanohalophilus levihalophilus]